MNGLCNEPILTGETAGVRSWEPCGRALHGSTGMCIDHARDAGLTARSVISAEAREKMAAGRRGRKSEKKPQANDAFAEIRRLRKEATARRRFRETGAYDTNAITLKRGRKQP